MAEWSVELPDEVAEGDEGHVEDHNAIVSAITEVRGNVDNIELTPGPPGNDGADGADGFPTEAQWNELLGRVTALEGGDDA